jgi:predicted ATPase
LAESPENLTIWKDRILVALGKNVRVAITSRRGYANDAIPALARVVGQQADVPSLEATEAEQRFNLVFKNFTQLFTSIEHPLVLVLDDLQ